MQQNSWLIGCLLVCFLAGCAGGGGLFAPRAQTQDAMAPADRPSQEEGAPRGLEDFEGPPSEQQLADAARAARDEEARPRGPTERLLAPGAAGGGELARWELTSSQSGTAGETFRDPSTEDDAESGEGGATSTPVHRAEGEFDERGEQGSGETTRQQAAGPAARGDRWGRERDGESSTDASGHRSELIELKVYFEVLRVDLPRAEGRTALKIWNHLDESLGDPGLTALLARNGFRVGVGDDETWPALRAIFEANGARTAHADQIAASGAPLILPLGEVHSGNSYFLHRRTAGLEGGTFPDGQCQFQIDFAANERDLASVELRIAPRLEEARTRTRVVDQRGALVTVRDRPAQVFEELAATLTVAPGAYVVVGSSTEAKPAGEGFLLGSWWFTARLGAETFETVLCIKPKLTQLGARASAP